MAKKALIVYFSGEKTYQLRVMKNGLDGKNSISLSKIKGYIFVLISSRCWLKEEFRIQGGAIEFSALHYLDMKFLLPHPVVEK